MSRALALLLVLATTVLVRFVGAGEPLELHSAALALGFALIAAGLAGSLVVPLGLPRVTGYLLFGLFCGPYVANLISRPMAAELRVLNDLAVVLIAFVAGLEMNLARMRPRMPAILRVGVTSIALTNLAFFAVFWVVWGWLPILPSASGLQKIGLVMLLSTVVSSYSPSVTMAIIAETRAAGPLSELVMAVVILGDLVLIVSFAAAMQLARVALGGAGAGEGELVGRLAWQILGSLAFGGAAGAMFALYVKTVGREVTIVLLALCVAISALSHRLHFEAVLAALAAGLMVENIAPPRGDLLKAAVERGSLPILVVFFTAAGASLQLDTLADLGLVALAISALRTLFVWGATRLGERVAELPRPPGGLVWTGLIPQAGVTLGLVGIVATEFPSMGVAFETLAVALVGIHQLVGPVVFRVALGRAGEVGMLSVPRPERSAPLVDPGPSAV